MNCEQFDQTVADIAAARREPGDAERMHIAVCRSCQQRLADAQRLVLACADLKRDMARRVPPAAVERQLAAHFARHHARPVAMPRPRFGWNRWMAASLAAAVVLSWVIVFDGGRRLHRPATLEASGFAGAAHSESAYRPAVATPFYPVQARDGLRLARASGVVRVTMPRATLAVFGLPFNPRRANDPIAAELLVDNGGAVTAVRFVQ